MARVADLTEAIVGQRIRVTSASAFHAESEVKVEQSTSQTQEESK